LIYGCQNVTLLPITGSGRVYRDHHLGDWAIMKFMMFQIADHKKYTVFKKQPSSSTFYFPNNSVKSQPILVFFYRASACCACSARYCFSKSVCLSVTRWYCIETNAHIVKLFPSSGRGMAGFLGLPPKFQEEGWENLSFLTEIAVYLGNGTRLGPCYYGQSY